MKLYFDANRRPVLPGDPAARWQQVWAAEPDGYEVLIRELDSEKQEVLFLIGQDYTPPDAFAAFDHHRKDRQ